MIGKQTYVQFREDAGHIVLDAIEDLDGRLPPYCVHGRTRCLYCGRECYLGDKTHDAVASGEVKPICLTCIRKSYPLGVPGDMPVRNIGDHQRKDGPHP